jgi:hypothetical protein
MAYVWYYRCPDCEHIWTIDKKDDAKITHVTPLRPKDEGRPS